MSILPDLQASGSSPVFAATMFSAGAPTLYYIPFN
jgi:hypothetical protein